MGWLRKICVYLDETNIQCDEKKRADRSLVVVSRRISGLTTNAATSGSHGPKLSRETPSTSLVLCAHERW